MDKIIFYLTLNYPNEIEFNNILTLLNNKGVKYVEIGLPVSNPIHDGDIIKETHIKVYNKDLNQDYLEYHLNLLKNRYDFKIILMTYQEGFDKFNILKVDEDLYDGVLITNPDISLADIPKPIQTYNTNMTKEVVSKKISNNVEFAYLQTSTGLTGSEPELEDKNFLNLLNYLKKNLNIPIYFGFGMKTKKDLDVAIKMGANGIIIGTKLIKIFNEKGLTGVEEYLKALDYQSI